MNVENDYLIFVVENNKIFNHLVTEYLKRQHFTRIKSVFSGEECVQLVEGGEIPNIVVQDYLLEGMNGIDVLKEVKKKSPRTDFLFLTSNENMEVAVNTIKFGAYDYIVKDRLALEKVVYKLNKIIEFQELRKRGRQARMGIFLFFSCVFLLVAFAFFYFVMGVFRI